MKIGNFETACTGEELEDAVIHLPPRYLSSKYCDVNSDALSEDAPEELKKEQAADKLQYFEPAQQGILI